MRPTALHRLHQLMATTSRANTFSTSTVPAGVEVFDRRTKLRQRAWAVQQGANFEAASQLLEEVGWRVADKVFDLTKFNQRVLDIGCRGGHIARHMIHENVGRLTMIDGAESVVRLARGPDDEKIEVERLVCDEETLDVLLDRVRTKGSTERFDLIVSSLAAHWINDLPGFLKRCYELLQDDAPIIGALWTTDTLGEMRSAIQLAELERLGGVGRHVSPLVEPIDLGGLLASAGFQLVTLDVDKITIAYPNLFALLTDLQLMGESGCTRGRSTSISRDVLVAADAIYKSMYGTADGNLPATFQILSFIGWRPGEKTPKPVKRGSQQVSLKDLSKLMEEHPDGVGPATGDGKK